MKWNSYPVSFGNMSQYRVKENVGMLFHVDFKTRGELWGLELECLWTDHAKWQTMFLTVPLYTHTYRHTHTCMHFHPCIRTILTATVLSLLLEELKIDAFCWNWDDEPVRVAETSFLSLLIFYDLLHWAALLLWHEDRCCGPVCPTDAKTQWSAYSTNMVQNRALKISLCFILYPYFEEIVS